MTFRTTLIFTITLLCSTIRSYSQNASGYSFQAVSGTYAALTGTTNVGGMTATGDDEISNVVNLGFTFKFAGVDYTQIKVSSNGWLTFNTAVATSEPSNAWIQINNQRPTIFPLWDNLQNRVIPRYRVDGSAPNRIFKLEWSQSEWSASSGGNTISFQVWLYETSNQIDFIYQQGGTAVASGSASIGLFDTNGKHLALDGTGTSPNALNTVLTTNLNTKPANGQIYRFTPPQFNSEFISFNTGAQTWCPGETRNVSVTVKNTGTSTWSNAAPDINIGAKWNTGGSYTLVNANGLSYGSTQTYNFSMTAPTTAGVHFLQWDVINSTAGCEFANNSGTCKADNAIMVSNHIVIKEFPPIDAGTNTAICLGNSTTINGTSAGVFDPVVLLNENFEASTPGNLPLTGTGWKYVVASGVSTMRWQIKASCDPINGLQCLNMNDGLGTDCDYRWTGNTVNSIAFYGTAINATGMSNLKLNFRYKIGGSAGNDYGMVCYSTNGLTWTDLATVYVNQPNWSAAINVALPAALNNTSFYIGFRWINDAIGSANSAAPGFCIDDVLIVGNSPTAQPVTLSWSPAGTLSSSTIINPVASPTSTTTYTLTATSSGCSTTDQVTITVDQPSTAPTSISGGGITICPGQTVALTQSGGALGGSAVYQWYSGSCGGTFVGNGNTVNVSPITTTNYFVRASANGACPATGCPNTTITLTPQGTTLSANNESRTCLVSGSNWIHFYHNPSGRYIGAIHPQGQNLGNVTMTSYLDGTNALVYPCGSTDPQFATSVNQRHWVVTPTTQPSSNVNVKLPFTNTEQSTLVTISSANVNPNDNVSTLGSVRLSRYHGPNNVNSSATDNCPALGGNGGTTIHSQSANGNLNTILAGFVNTSYIDFPVPQFSELWLHGSSINSPLAATIDNYEANCSNDASVVVVRWSTSTETNVSHFELDKSYDLDTWISLGIVNGAGNSNTSQFYELRDESKVSFLTWYYRLRQYDIDGTLQNVKIVTAQCENDEFTFEIFPNPANDIVNVIVSNGSTTANAIEFTDLNGKILNSILLNGDSVVQLNVQHLSTGVYFISTKDQEGKLQVRRLVKD